MAKKPFYSMDEVCAKLSKSQEEIKALVREGVLREFRDAGKIFFKAEDIDKLTGTTGTKEDTGEVLLEPAGDLEPLPAGEDMPALTESSSGGTSIIGLEPLPEEQEEAPPARKKGDTAVPKKGVGVFSDEELEGDTDPMAKTQITTGAVDQITLEGAGSGSGLLDLAREADDTALGADLLDEIYPGEEEVAPEAAEEPAAEAPAAETAEETLEAVEGGEVVLPAIAPVGDPYEGMFTGLLVGGLVVMGLAASVVGGLVQGFVPDYGRFLGDGKTFFLFLGGALLVAVIGLLAGWFVGKAFSPRGR